jgi:lysophospholipase L1-like esterase
MIASAAALNATLPGIYINGEVSRAMVNGLAVIQTLAARHQLRHYVVVGLGTNGPVSAAQVRQLRHLIGPNRDIILINTFGPMPWESSVNTVLDAAGRHTARVSLADWHAAIAGHTSLLWPDRIHPQPAGARVYARIVLAAIAAQLPPAAAPSCGPQVSGPQVSGPR